MKIKVDFDLCESNAMCEALAPDVFELDDDDFLQLNTDEVTDENEQRVRQAVAACPRAAISLVEDDERTHRRRPPASTAGSRSSPAREPGSAAPRRWPSPTRALAW